MNKTLESTEKEFWERLLKKRENYLNRIIWQNRLLFGLLFALGAAGTIGTFMTEFVRSNIFTLLFVLASCAFLFFLAGVCHHFNRKIKSTRLFPTIGQKPRKVLTAQVVSLRWLPINIYPLAQTFVNVIGLDNSTEQFRIPYKWGEEAAELIDKKLRQSY